MVEEFLRIFTNFYLTLERFVQKNLEEKFVKTDFCRMRIIDRDLFRLSTEDFLCKQ